MIVERVQSHRLPATIADACGLTRRQSDMVCYLLQGYFTKQIATMLRISPYTVQKHFGAIFEKASVRSRRALVGKVFDRLCAPRARQPSRSPSS